MKDEAAAGLDRTAVVDRAIRRFPGIDVELAKEASKGDARPFVSDADADRPIFVMDAHCDDRALESRIGHSRHCQQQLAGEEARLLDHRRDNGTLRRGGQGLRRLSGEPISRLS
jgi:hypothetical protein